jgi:ABC-type uncharacterized transport system substrate-binding protein
MRRRQFIGLVGSFAVTWPLEAHAQQPERVRRIGVLMSFADPTTQSYVTAFQGALTKLGWRDGSNLRTEVRWGAGDADKIRSFAKEIVDLRPDAIVGQSTPVVVAMVLSSPAFSKHRAQLAALAIEHRLPTMFTFRHYVDGGGLMSYGVEFPLLWRRTADYVARILKGAKAAELPIEQPTKFELVVNLKTAKTLGITIPNGILLAADEVIE